MKKFQFKLQPLLKYRLRGEEIEEIRLNELLRQGQELDSALESESRSLTAIQQEVRGKKTILSEELRLYERYISALRHQLKRLETQKSKLNHTIAQQQLALTSARQKRKVLDRLKQRSERSHSQQVESRQQQASDELYLQRKSRK